MNFIACVLAANFAGQTVGSAAVVAGQIILLIVPPKIARVVGMRVYRIVVTEEFTESLSRCGALGVGVADAPFA